MFLLAEVASAEAVESLRGDVRSLIFWGAIALFAACLYFGVDAVKKWFSGLFAKGQAYLDNRIAPSEDAKRPSADHGISPAALLDSMRAGSVTDEATLRLRDSNGKRYELSYSLKEVQPNG